MNQSKDPLRPEYQNKGVDLTNEQTDQLVAFVRSLPRPEQVMPEDPNQRSFVNQGAVLFDAIGCAECHVKDVGQVEAVFSDFLLHNMGSEFEDPVPAQRVKSTKVGAGITMPKYYGAEPIRFTEVFYTVEEQNHHKEYRTPPLWGVADSAPYLHDGRATTLRAAIEWHGGEAMASRMNFARLNEMEQLSILKFLESLKAPQSAEEASNQIAGEEAAPASEPKISSIPSGTIEAVAARK